MRRAYPDDVGHNLNLVPFLSASLESVQKNFERFGLLDEQVRFVEGLVQRHAAELSDRAWSVIRLDGDLYESTINALDSLYPNLSDGGYLIVDDYGELEPAGRRSRTTGRAHDIQEEIQTVDDELHLLAAR